MAPAGGICFMLLHALFVLCPMPLAAKCIAGTVLMTAVEFLFGWVVNIRLGRSVWDYSNMKLNLYGQKGKKHGFSRKRRLNLNPISLKTNDAFGRA